MSSITIFRHRATTILLLLAWMLPAGASDSPAVSAAMQKAVRLVTLEVVIPKATIDQLTYEKTLPLELIPFVERSDAYWSIGTAFALGDNRFVTAAHVIVATVGSQLGTPALRDGVGRIYPLDAVLKFSLHEDFIVFSVRDAPDIAAPSISRVPRIDDPVFAVGNALGEGIIIRSGLLTSETPEHQDGRWKWLRFSAATSPGNSGGPLLNNEGNIIGVVIGKSPNENLNYALPISQVLDAPANVASIDQRYLQKQLNMNNTLPAHFLASLPLPASFSEFSSRYLSTAGDEDARSLRELRDRYAGDTFPRGSGASQVLGTLATDDFPRLIGHDDNNRWVADKADDIVKIDLDGNISIATAEQFDVTLFRLRIPPSTGHAATSGRELMEVVLKSQRLARPVGPDWVRVTSLGDPNHQSRLTDTFGRHWQLMTWPLRYMDALIVALVLPLPDGYAGIVDTAPAFTYLPAVNKLRLLLDYFHLSYSGTPPQWRSFLDNSDLRPDGFAALRITDSKARGVEIEAPRFSLQLPPEILQIGTDGTIDLLMTYVLDRDVLRWEVGGVTAREAGVNPSLVSVYRQSRPNNDAGPEQKEWWRKMVARESPFNMRPTPDPGTQSVWIRGIAAPAVDRDAQASSDPEILYDVSYSTKWESAMPWDLDRKLRTTLQYLAVLEGS